MAGRAAQARSCSTSCRDRAVKIKNRELHNEQRRQRIAAETHEQRELRLAQRRDWGRRNYDAERSREQYLANRDAVLEAQKQYRVANAESVRERGRAYYAANRAKWVEAYRASTAEDRARRNAQNRERWARKVADGTIRRSQWKQDNPDAARISARLYQHRRRAWKRQAPIEPVSVRDIDRLMARHDGLCVYCKTARATDLDHVIPLSRGGAHSIGNLTPACGRCNRSKGAKTVTEWRLTPTRTLRAS